MFQLEKGLKAVRPEGITRVQYCIFVRHIIWQYKINDDLMTLRIPSKIFFKARNKGFLMLIMCVIPYKSYS